MRVHRSVVLALLGILLAPVSSRAGENDTALDAILELLRSDQPAVALQKLGALPVLPPAQAFRADYYRASAHYRLNDRDLAERVLLSILPPAGQTDRSAFVQSNGLYGEKARALLAAIYNETKRYDNLSAIYSGMMMDYPQNPEYLYLYADALFHTDRFVEAADAYGQYAQIPSKPTRHAAAFFRRAESLRLAGGYEDAYNWLSSLPAETPEWEIKAAAARSEYMTLHLHWDYDLAERLCEEMIAKYPDHPAIFLCHYRRARNCLYDFPSDRKDAKKAREILLPLVTRFPDEGMALDVKQDIAYSYSLENDSDKAIHWYRRALEEHPDPFPAGNSHSYLRSAIAGHYLRKGDQAAALVLWREIIAKYPDDPLTVFAHENVAREEARRASR